jgi:hypothetical protein
MKSYLSFLFGCLLFVGAAFSAEPAGDVFEARLSPLAVTNATVNIITGMGAVAATLRGSQLSLDVTFAGLTGNATTANVRRGAKGIPGPVVFTLDVPKAANGKFSAALVLTAEQIADLRAGKLYLQIHSERAPDGSIRGWLLK